jgi:NAD(P)-dependent dehydrogenase (short-subunit alcohol dehydrogenase family)
MDYYDERAIFRRFRRYQDSKFVVHAFVQHLARNTSPVEVIINTVCPGVVDTTLNQTVPLWFKPVLWAYTKMYRRTLNEGGRIIVKAAVVLGNESHGLFVQNGQMDRYVLDSRVTRLWY